MAETPVDVADKLPINPIDRRLSRDIGIQAFSLDIDEEKENEKEKTKLNEEKNGHDERHDRKDSMQIEAQHKCKLTAIFSSHAYYVLTFV